VAGIEQLQKIKGFPAANLSQDDSVGPVAKRGFQQVADRDGGKIVLRLSSFEAHEVVLHKMDFRCVLDDRIRSSGGMNLPSTLSNEVFALPLGSVSEIVTIEGGSPLVNVESGSVSTVIGHDLIEKLPLNGRSFNTLLQLTPGVVIAPSSPSNQGQFSMAGQRTSASNFLVDGVSANFGVSPLASLGTSGTGSAQAFSALGGTSSLVSVEALQEFRVETSSFAPSSVIHRAGRCF